MNATVYLSCVWFAVGFGRHLLRSYLAGVRVRRAPTTKWFKLNYAPDPSLINKATSINAQRTCVWNLFLAFNVATMSPGFGCPSIVFIMIRIKRLFQTSNWSPPVVVVVQVVVVATSSLLISWNLIAARMACHTEGYQGSWGKLSMLTLMVSWRMDSSLLLQTLHKDVQSFLVLHMD